MEIKRENVVKAYMAGDNNVKEMLRAIFPDIDFEAEKQTEKRPITERVKTFEDACKELGTNHPLVLQYEFNYNAEGGWNDSAETRDFSAYLKLRIVCAALNEGWEPQFMENEWRWYPWHFLWTAEELADKDEEWKCSHALIDTGDYQQEGYAGFAYANSFNYSSHSDATFGSRLCLKDEALADYCGKQFIELWADFKLIRRK